MGKPDRNQWSIGNEKLYGEPTDIDYSAEYSQSASGYFNTYLRIGNFYKIFFIILAYQRRFSGMVLNYRKKLWNGKPILRA